MVSHTQRWTSLQVIGIWFQCFFHEKMSNKPWDSGFKCCRNLGKNTRVCQNFRVKLGSILALESRFMAGEVQGRRETVPKRVSLFRKHGLGTKSVWGWKRVTSRTEAEGVRQGKVWSKAPLGKWRRIMNDL